jgi:DNA-binding transcriptional LysR family regulator
MEWTSVQLRSLVELRRRTTITAVARALGYTPGGISQQLAALERSAGVPLLRRAGRRVEFTDAGAALVAHAERILGIEAEMVAALEMTTERVEGTLEVGLFATAAAEILPVTLTGAQERHPGLVISTRDMDVDAVYDAVASGTVDLALGLDYPDVPIRRDPELQVVPLLTERFFLASPVGMLGGAEVISLADSASLRWILPAANSHYGRAIRTVCRRAGFEPDVRHEVTDTAASLALVEAGVGVAPATDLMMRLRPSRCDVVRLAETFERHIVVIVRAAAQRRPTVAALLGVLRELSAYGRTA